MHFCLITDSLSSSILSSLLIPCFELFLLIFIILSKHDIKHDIISFIMHVPNIILIMYNGHINPAKAQTGQIKQNKITIQNYNRPRKGSYCQYKQQKLNRDFSINYNQLGAGNSGSVFRNMPKDITNYGMGVGLRRCSANTSVYQNQNTDRGKTDDRLQKYSSKQIKNTKRVSYDMDRNERTNQRMMQYRSLIRPNKSQFEESKQMQRRPNNYTNPQMHYEHVPVNLERYEYLTKNQPIQTEDISKVNHINQRNKHYYSHNQGHNQSEQPVYPQRSHKYGRPNNGVAFQNNNYEYGHQKQHVYGTLKYGEKYREISRQEYRQGPTEIQTGGARDRASEMRVESGLQMYTFKSKQCQRQYPAQLQNQLNDKYNHASYESQNNFRYPKKYCTDIDAIPVKSNHYRQIGYPSDLRSGPYPHNNQLQHNSLSPNNTDYKTKPSAITPNRAKYAERNPQPNQQRLSEFSRHSQLPRYTQYQKCPQRNAQRQQRQQQKHPLGQLQNREKQNGQKSLRTSRKDSLIQKSKLLRQKLNNLSGSAKGKQFMSASKSTKQFQFHTLNDQKNESYQERIQRLRNNKDRQYNSPFKQTTKSSSNLKSKFLLNHPQNQRHEFRNQAQGQMNEKQNQQDFSIRGQQHQQDKYGQRKQKQFGKSCTKAAMNMQTSKLVDDNCYNPLGTECMTRINSLNSKINEKISSIINSYAK